MPRGFIRLATPVLFLGLLVGPLPIWPSAGPPAAVFPNTTECGGRSLVLNGVGLAEWGVFSWDLYWAALYLEKRTSLVNEILDPGQAKRIHLYFERALTRKQMIAAFTASFEVNAGEQLARYRNGLDQLIAALTAVKVQDSLVFSFVPGQGLSVELNGECRAMIESDSFSVMFFRLYVGDKPPTEALRRALVGTHS